MIGEYTAVLLALVKKPMLSLKIIKGELDELLLSEELETRIPNDIQRVTLHESLEAGAVQLAIPTIASSPRKASSILLGL